jgi:hypothetical protein
LLTTDSNNTDWIVAVLLLLLLLLPTGSLGWQQEQWLWP